MTWGQCGWLDLHCLGLSPFTTVPAFPALTRTLRFTCTGERDHVVHATSGFVETQSSGFKCPMMAHGLRVIEGLLTQH